MKQIFSHLAVTPGAGGTYLIVIDNLMPETKMGLRSRNIITIYDYYNMI